MWPSLVDGQVGKTPDEHTGFFRHAQAAGEPDLT